jgi:hypothetical protein
LLSQHPLQLVGEQIVPPLDADPLLDVDAPLPELEPLVPLVPDEPLEPLLEEDESSPASGGLPSSPVPLLLVGPVELEPELEPELYEPLDPPMELSPLKSASPFVGCGMAPPSKPTVVNEG